MKDSLCIIGILVDNRTESIPEVQDILTKNGDIILTRVGIHDPGEEQRGLITLNAQGSRERIRKLEDELMALDGVSLKSMVMRQ